jgi:nickel-dependent lactate racemase
MLGGYGEHVFEEWLLTLINPGSFRKSGREFQLGGHKAVAIAMVLEKAQVFFVSDMPHIKRPHVPS